MRTSRLLPAAVLAASPLPAYAIDHQINTGVSLLFGSSTGTPIAVEAELGWHVITEEAALSPLQMALGPVVEARFGKGIEVATVVRGGAGAYATPFLTGVTSHYPVTELEFEGGVAFGTEGLHAAWGGEAQILPMKFAVRGAPGTTNPLWMGPGVEVGILGFHPSEYLYAFAVEGRPYRHNGRAVRPRVVGDRRDPRAARWMVSASEELAAVAAFERLAAELRTLGAPGGLVARAAHAAAEERGHARMCLRRAAAWSERVVVATPIRAEARRIDRRDEAIAVLGVESLLDGLQNEGRAAADHLRDVDAGERADRPTHRRIATEERTHATLGDDLYAWARREAPSATRRALARLG